MSEKERLNDKVQENDTRIKDLEKLLKKRKGSVSKSEQKHKDKEEDYEKVCAVYMVTIVVKIIKFTYIVRMYGTAHGQVYNSCRLLTCVV